MGSWFASSRRTARRCSCQLQLLAAGVQRRPRRNANAPDTLRSWLKIHGRSQWGVVALHRRRRERAVQMTEAESTPHSTALCVDVSLSMPMRDVFSAAQQIAASLSTFLEEDYPQEIALTIMSCIGQRFYDHEGPNDLFQHSHSGRCNCGRVPRNGALVLSRWSTVHASSIGGKVSLPKPPDQRHFTLDVSLGPLRHGLGKPGEGERMPRCLLASTEPAR